MTNETVQAENAESVQAIAPEVQAEKIECATNGDVKENGNGCGEHATTEETTPANGEAPNAASTPIKSKKRRAIVANMRAAFQRMGLMSQLRALGRRMRRSPKNKAEANGTAEKPAEEEKAAEKPAENGLLDGAALLATTTTEEPVQENGKCNGNGHAAHDEPAAAAETNGCNGEETTSAPVVEPASNDTIEQTAVVAQ